MPWKDQKKVNENKYKWNRTHKKEYNAQIRRWRVKHKDHFNAYQRKWRADNPEKAAANDNNKRARRLGAKGECTKQRWLWRVEYYGWRCVYCKMHLTLKTLTKDHSIPISRGGTNWPSNLVPACGHCNYSKRHRTPAEFVEYSKGDQNALHRSCPSPRTIPALGKPVG